MKNRSVGRGSRIAASASRWRAARRWAAKALAGIPSAWVPAAALVCAWLWSASSATALPVAAERTLDKVHAALADVEIEEARRWLEPLHRDHPRDASVLALLAQLRFHEGDYPGAVGAMEASVASIASPTEGSPVEEALALFRASVQATAGFVRHTTPDGRFEILYAPGPDAVLVPYALQALRRMDRALEEELGYRHPGPIRLELYGSADQLAAVSSLTVEAIARTGTIALCKWDRLMVTSPRALLQGYPWMDTIAHEMVHLVLSRMTRDRAPVWLQEGIAKYLERRWRVNRATAGLTPSVRTLLSNAVHAPSGGRAGSGDGLIPFDQLHPSIALLPSQEDAALAFAQVSTFIETYVREQGTDALRDGLARIARGSDARDALAQSASSSFTHLESEWRRALAARSDLRPARGEIPFRDMQLRTSGASATVDSSDDATRARAAEAARRWLRIGDLLWARRRYLAAAEEYARAVDKAEGDPVAASRLARAALAAGDHQRATTALKSVLQRYPDHAPARALLGSALRLAGDREGARHSARLAIGLNPFDPRPHCDLAEVARTQAARDAEARRCTELGP